MDNSTKSYIYAIKSEQLQLVKIGFSGDPDARFEQLAQQSPVELAFVAVWEGSSVQEKEIHAYLKDYRKLGEWFSLSSYQAIDKVSAFLGCRPIWRPERPVFDPAAVSRHSESDLAGYSHLDDFIASHLEAREGDGVQLNQLFEIYQSWTGEKDITPLSIRGFASSLRERGLIVKPTGRHNMVTVVGRRLISGACSGRIGQNPDENFLRPELCPED